MSPLRFNRSERNERSRKKEKGRKPMEAKSRLKPCPFCGNKNVKQVTAPLKGTQMFICNVCGADVCFYGAEYDVKARKAWNRRSETEESK